MRAWRMSPSSLLLSLLQEADASPPDFLCPCDPQPPPQKRPQRRQPHASSSRLPTVSARGLREPVLEPTTNVRYSRAYDPDRFPRKFQQGEDGYYTLVSEYQFNGQSVTCSAQDPGTRTPTTNIDLSSDNGGDTYDATAPTEIPVVNASVDPSMPKGWTDKTGPYPNKTVVIASAVLAAIIAALIFGLILWRQPLKRPGRREGRDSRLRKILEDDSSGSLEKGIPGRDEDPDISRALRSRKRAFARALSRWKSKAKGKAAHHMRARPYSASSLSLDRPSRLASPSRARSPASASSSSSVSLASQSPTRSSSPAPSDVAPPPRETVGELDTRTTRSAPSLPASRRPSRSRSSPPSPPSSPPPPLSPHAPAHQHLPDPEGSLPPSADASSEPDGEQRVLSPPAYRRSYTAQTRPGEGPSAASASEIAPDAYDRKQALPPASPPPPPPLHPRSSVDESASLYDSSDAEACAPDAHPPSESGRDQARRQFALAHVATDEKAVLASIARMASAPDRGHAGDASAPAWDDDGDAFELPEDLLDDTIRAGPSAPPIPSSPPLLPDSLLPRPPSRLQQRSLLDFASAPPLPAPPDGLATSDAPSAPLDAFDDDDDDVLGPTALTGSMVNLPRYER
ncbi:hypothetical protein EXIGLDRAFT_733545 [Exidia glandulosa HHB12029]|uniref:Proteophosphoglycan ppg4 n=1 Tax=Exidia glandulosa HHB12029 TaxID=1314781 RepID=A0A165BA03_EXIGL|nr:hypothetical protein EXIGLDRAFT_733545 [Exidia glandulosa HHB12029]